MEEEGGKSIPHGERVGIDIQILPGVIEVGGWISTANVVFDVADVLRQYSLPGMIFIDHVGENLARRKVFARSRI